MELATVSSYLADDLDTRYLSGYIGRMKYMGGKTRIKKYILPIILANRKPGQWYVEPFAGGMNVICEVAGPRLANDANPYMIAMWKALSEGWEPEKITKKQHTEIRANPEKYPPHIVGYAGANGYCGKFFGAFAGEVMTKSAGLVDFQGILLKSLALQAPKMRGVKFVSGEYDGFDIPDNSIIYCDPPYKSTAKYRYGIDHDKFWDWAASMAILGHQVFVSEYSAPDDFTCVWSRNSFSAMQSNSFPVKITEEKLFVYSRVISGG